MKIKTDFITNSSSTSFILIYGTEFGLDEFLELVGMKKESDFSFLFARLYQDLWEKKKPIRETYDDNMVKERFSKEVLSRILEAEKEGKKVFAGTLSSENNEIESFFCTDSFIIQNDTFYLNAINCVW